MTHKPRHIETAGKWLETEEGILYAAVAQSRGEVLAKVDFTLMIADSETGSDGEEILPESTQAKIEREIKDLVRQQAVRLLDRREERPT